jgi:hypothetical protein
MNAIGATGVLVLVPCAIALIDIAADSGFRHPGRHEQPN